MSNFLHLLARDIVQKYQENFEQLTIIFPNKRAGLFLASELSGLIKKPVWMPEILTISEFIGKHTGMKKAEELPLIIKLYKAYTTVSGTDEKFDDFYFWGNMLLNDFDDIDKYLVDPKAIFSNLVALKEIEQNFPFLTGEQIEIIKKFWSTFHTEKFSREQQEFLKVWDNLYPAYLEFKKQLFRENICYEGMGIRYFCEHIEEFQIDNHLIFAGFNALSQSERQIFSHFQSNGSARFYWDYDIYYTSDEYQEAGRFMRDNLRLFPNELGQEHFNNFRYGNKDIAYIAVPSSVGQAKLIPELTKDTGEENDIQTAIVLCDERMLIPVIHSIPEHIRKVNITMGYPAINTSVASFLHLLGEVKKYQKGKNEEVRFYYKPVMALLNHKLLKQLCPEEIDRFTDHIAKQNIIYVATEDLNFNATVASVFSSGAENPAEELLYILSLLLQTLKEEKGSLFPIEKDFIFNIYTRIQALKNTFREENIVPEAKLYWQIIQKIIQTATIPFAGEPIEGLQLMGLLETRLLDFKNIILLSANEGIIPKTNPSSSFIPYNLRFGFKLPTPEHQEALYAYYFYRLLQRAQNIRILYSSGAQGIASNEMSRFLYQIKYESGLKVKELNFQNRISLPENPPISIEKSEEIQQALAALCSSETQALSPSALNSYLECPLRFYLKYIARIKEKEEVTEELDHRLLGNIFHESSESLYKLISEKEITPEVIERLRSNIPEIDEHIKRSYAHFYHKDSAGFIDSAGNDLVLEVIRKFIRRMFEYDKTIAPFRMLSMEQKYSCPVSVQINGTKKNIWIGGYIDRIDQRASGIRIIDYKTGADTSTFKNIPSLFERENKTRNKAAFQLLLYCLIYDESVRPALPLSPGIYSIKLMFSPEYSDILKCDKDDVRNFSLYKTEFYEQLIPLLEELFCPEIPFTQATDTNKCRNCPYNTICNR